MEIVVKSATVEDTKKLNQDLPTSIPAFHENHVVDKNADWLIAYQGDLAVGHFLVRWDGCHNPAVKKYVNNCPHLESGGVKEEYRKQGVATKLINTAEKMAKNKGYQQIGMAVGSDDNPNARHLYEKLGYVEWSHGTFEESWLIRDSEGNETVERETCTYLVKIFRESQ